MASKRLAWCLLALFSLAPAVRGGEVDLTGTWKLGVVSGVSATERPVAILRFARVNNEWTGTVVAASFKKTEVKSVTLKDGTLRLVVQPAPGSETVFEGVVAPGGKHFKGSYGNDAALSAASLSPTKAEKITKDMTVTFDVPALKKVAALNARVQDIAKQYSKTKDKDEQAKLFKEYKAAVQAVQKESVPLYREVVARNADSPVVVDVVLALLRNPARAKLTADEVKTWAAAANRVATTHGKRYELYAATEIARLALMQSDLALVALEQATRAERLLDQHSSLERQADVLAALHGALRTLGKATEAKAIAGRLDQVTTALDRDYQKKLPPIKLNEFTGRKGDRAVVMELFTGAQCPPCVAADLAFDALVKTYPSKDVVLIQYHLHIPGPDPMTNADTEARWAYYRKLFPDTVRGVPTALFNGKVLPGGGGGMAQGPGKYKQYCGVIEPLLEDKSVAKLAARANRIGDKVSIEATVRGLKDNGNVKLRLLLVEETIRYVGGNKIRFHHQVVRAFPGGVEGVAVKGGSSKHSADINLVELRKNLNRYLDDYAANKRPFPKTERPLDFAHLRVIAMLQDDTTAEILQATQVEVGGDKEGR